MIRVVLDTNIIVSALLQPLGPSAQIFTMALSGSIQMCMTGPVYAEYEEVIRRPRLKRSDEIITATLQSIRDNALWVRPSDKVRACLDPDDDMFLECAQAARADYLVTGNTKDFPISWEGTPVITPRAMLDHIINRRSS
ncbi:MAG TPA: putative toxin-antitoxin system toxin component, PIN family [Candidatus Solibacter sp.]|nr:putative toxin-antitoxin system toxin component, PIN family [Candidatus Solibacter sp.]